MRNGYYKRIAGLALALTGCCAKPVAVDPAPCLTVEFTDMSGEGIASWKFNSDGFAASCGEGGGGRDGPGRLRGRKPGRGRGPVQRGHRHLPLELRRRHGPEEAQRLSGSGGHRLYGGGLDEWGSVLDQIGQAGWDTLEESGKSALRQREGDSITGADCLGGYLLVRQDFSSEMVDTRNILYVAYKVQVQLPDGSALELLRCYRVQRSGAARRRLGGGDRRLWLHGLRQHRYAWRAASITTSPALRRRRP